MSKSVFEARYRKLRRRVDRRLAVLSGKSEPKDLAEGLRYVLTGGGKRVRSTLLLLSCEAVGGRVHDALDAGAAVEMMHNFTLVHDDIMDNAHSRRGKPTVHTKWDVNNALLVGDVLLGMAYDSLLRRGTSEIHSIAKVFTNSFLEVCEGQALDLEFGRRKNVSVSDYFVMIEKKTARLMSMACEIGAMIGRATERRQRALRQFGGYLGRAFQVQDDLLDVVAEPGRFGKTVGGDILEGKKTFLLIKAAECASGKERGLIQKVMHAKHTPVRWTAARRREWVATITDIYTRSGVIDSAQHQIARDTKKATAALNELPGNEATEMLHWFSGMLLKRMS